MISRNKKNYKDTFFYDNKFNLKSLKIFIYVCRVQMKKKFLKNFLLILVEKLHGKTMSRKLELYSKK